ncbi:hypothetical protein H2200_009090 [Cladophialophora chaetospira]|uniref:Glutathione S-transferase n=1 Tax=Cladophialophora chaetospira TaxID=386627 RepID=A0AA39CFA4_9EURO|nr:hypothetical protein H2200_009090 [Cladophialophora chaetospira]
MPNIQLFYWLDSSSVACHILLYETGLPFEAVQIQPTEESFAALRKLNPKARIPTLAIDGKVITETQAIMTAIAQLAPAKHLFGKNDLEAVRVHEWLGWLVGTFHGQAWVPVFRPERFSDDTSQHEAIRAKGLATLKELYRMLEEKVIGAYAVGDEFTAADAFLYVLFRWGSKWKIVNKRSQPNFCHAMMDFQERAAVKKVLDVEHLQAVDV